MLLHILDCIIDRALDLKLERKDFLCVIKKKGFKRPTEEPQS